MTEKKERNNILTVYLKLALIFNIMLIVGGMAILFSTSDTYGIYAAAIYSISALFNCIGITLLLRWHSTGFLIVGSTSLISAVSLSFTCAGWLNYYFGSVGVRYTRHAVACGLLADLSGVLAAIAICYFFFG